MPAENNRPVSLDPSLLPSSDPSPELPFAKPFTVPFAALIGRAGLNVPSGTRALSAMMVPSEMTVPAGTAVPPVPISVSAYIQFP
jgi:hypothetical protein